MDQGNANFVIDAQNLCSFNHYINQDSSYKW